MPQFLISEHNYEKRYEKGNDIWMHLPFRIPLNTMVEFLIVVVRIMFRYPPLA